MTPKSISPTQRMLNVWAFILIVWSFYRAKFGTNMPEWYDEFFAKPIVFIFPVYYYIKKIEKKPFFSSLNFHKKTLTKDIFIGLSIGGIFLISALLANLTKSSTIVFSKNVSLSMVSVVSTLLIALGTGLSEEILSRGFVLKRLYEESKNIYTSSFFSSLLFFFLHVPILFTNENVSGNLLLFFMGTDIGLSLVNSFIFLDRKSLIAPILIHALYNLTIIFFL